MAYSLWARSTRSTGDTRSSTSPTTAWMTARVCGGFGYAMRCIARVRRGLLRPAAPVRTLRLWALGRLADFPLASAMQSLSFVQFKTSAVHRVMPHVVSPVLHIVYCLTFCRLSLNNNNLPTPQCSRCHNTRCGGGRLSGCRARVVPVR